MNETVIDVAIVATFVLLGIATISAVAFPIFHMITNIKKAKGALIGFVVLAVILFVGYSLSTDEVYEGFNITPFQSQVIGGSIIATMILALLAVGAIIYTEISKLFK